MKKHQTPERPVVRNEAANPFKKIGIGAVAAAAQAMKPREAKAEPAKKDIPPVLLQEHWII